jgi:hypothetical protein
MTTSARILSKNKRSVKCNDGNWMNQSYIDCYKKVQEVNAENYNIIVFDGQAADKYCSKYFTAFNHHNATIVSDYSNADYLKKYCKGANVILVSGDYAKYLEDNVCKALRLAIR